MDRYIFALVFGTSLGMVAVPSSYAETIQIPSVADTATEVSRLLGENPVMRQDPRGGYSIRSPFEGWELEFVARPINLQDEFVPHGESIRVSDLHPLAFRSFTPPGGVLQLDNQPHDRNLHVQYLCTDATNRALARLLDLDNTERAECFIFLNRTEHNDNQHPWRVEENTFTNDPRA